MYCNNNYVLVEKDSGQSHRIFLGDIDSVIVETLQVTISAYLLQKLSEYKIRVIFCDEKHNPAGEYCPYYPTEDSAGKYRLQCGWTEVLKESAWQKIETDKVNSQKQILDYYGLKYDKSKTYGEAQFAAIYFRQLFGRGFVRFLNDPINAALNYGYTILLSAMNRKIINFGYCTQIGIHHCNAQNNFNFSCDLIEPFRPLTDLIVVRNRDCELNMEYKKLLIGIIDRHVYVNEKKYQADYAMNLYALYMIDLLNGKKNEDDFRLRII